MEVNTNASTYVGSAEEYIDADHRDPLSDIVAIHDIDKLRILFRYATTLRSSPRVVATALEFR